MNLPTPANSNYKPAEAGGIYHPEMGEHHDGKALFQAQYCWKQIALHWTPERHTEALAAFKAHRVRPSGMECSKTIKGHMKWGATVTWAAYRKLQSAKLTITEALLD